MIDVRGLAYHPSRSAIVCVFISGSCRPTASAPDRWMAKAIFRSPRTQPVSRWQNSLVRRFSSSPPWKMFCVITFRVTSGGGGFAPAGRGGRRTGGDDRQQAEQEPLHV